MLEEWEQQDPGRTANILSALSSVVRSHLADGALYDFKNLGAADGEGDTVFDPPEVAGPALGIYKIG